MQRPEMSLPPAYLAALVPLADAFSAYERATGSVAVLVGGAAAAIHTDGAFMSADFDVVAGNDFAFGEAMAAAGFEDDPKAVHVNRRSIGTPYRRAKGTPLLRCWVVDAGRGFRAAGGVGRA